MVKYFFFGVYVIRRYITTFVELLFETPSKPDDFIQRSHNLKLGSISWVICSHLHSRTHFSTSNYEMQHFNYPSINTTNICCVYWRIIKVLYWYNTSGWLLLKRNYEMTEYEGMWKKVVVRYFNELSGYWSGSSLWKP